MKVCMPCFLKHFHGRRIRILTWGRECAICHKPTPSLGLLVRVN